MVPEASPTPPPPPKLLSFTGVFLHLLTICRSNSDRALFPTMAMFSEGGSSSPDIWMILLTIVIAGISVLLNPLVFRHNYHKRRSIARDLFMALSVTDFISSIVMSITIITGILAPVEDQCIIDHNSTFCHTQYYKYNRTATTTEKAVGGVIWSLVFIPMIITATQAIARWYQITYPLRNLNRKAVEIILALSCLTWLIVSQRFLFHDSPNNPVVFKMIMQTVTYHSIDTIFGYFPLILVFCITSTSTTASAITVRNIVKSEDVQGDQQTRRRKLRSSMKIALMNAGNLGWEFVAVARFLSGEKGLYVVQSFLSCLSTAMSAYNPVVYILLTDRIIHNSRVEGGN